MFDTTNYGLSYENVMNLNANQESNESYPKVAREFSASSVSSSIDSQLSDNSQDKALYNVTKDESAHTVN